MCSGPEDGLRCRQGVKPPLKNTKQVRMQGGQCNKSYLLQEKFSFLDALPPRQRSVGPEQLQLALGGLIDLDLGLIRIALGGLVDLDLGFGLGQRQFAVFPILITVRV